MLCACSTERGWPVMLTWRGAAIVSLCVAHWVTVRILVVVAICPNGSMFGGRLGSGFV